MKAHDGTYDHEGLQLCEADLHVECISQFETIGLEPEGSKHPIITYLP